MRWTGACHAETTLLVATSPRSNPPPTHGIDPAHRGSGAIVAGICFYQSYAGELAAANGWTRLLTNSAKLTNIIGGYGYRPTLASLAAASTRGCRAGRLMPITSNATRDRPGGDRHRPRRPG